MKKLLALLLCLSMLAVPLLSCGSDPAPAPEGGGSDPAPTPEGGGSDEIPVTYDAVIDKYIAVLTAAKDGTPVADMERTGADTLGADIMNAIYDTVAACEEPLDMGYGTKDIDGDGTDELLLMSARGVAHALFTQKNGKILFLIDLGAQGAIDEEGNIYKIGYDAETKTSLSTLCRLQNGVLISHEYGETRTSDDTGVHFSYFKTVNGERVTIEKSEHGAFYNMYFKCDGSFLRIATHMTRQAHFRYTPALAREPGEAAVTVDYSSYEAVLETYKKIVAALPEFDLLWASNGYHNRFMTDNSPEYEYTDRLLQACALYDEGGALSFGYAKKDLNGDGSDELMLMTEGREVFAVFTLQKGKPALIYAANGYNTVLIAPDGRLHCEQYMNSMDHSQVKVLSITADGTPRTDGFIGGYIEGYDYRYYKAENGLRVPATQDEADAVRDLYKSFVEYGSQAELNYLKCTLALPYEPLDKEASSSVEADTVWSISADIIGALRLTVTALDDSSVSFVLSSFDFDTAEYEPVITATAEKNGDCYTFDTDEASGTVELGISGIWLDVAHLQNSDDMDVGLQFFRTLVEEKTP